MPPTTTPRSTPSGLRRLPLDRLPLSDLGALLVRLDLVPTDAATALAASYALRAADAVHLATALDVGADRFITTNARDFPTTIAEIDIAYPADLPLPQDL